MTPQEILEWADRLAEKERDIVIKTQFGEIRLKVGRLTLLDSILIDKSEGRNPLLELLDVAGQRAGIYEPFPFSVQAKIFYYGVLKFHPEFTFEDALAVFELLPPDERARVVAWILSGVTDEKRPIVYTRGGHPALRIDFWIPLLSHLYGYSARELLELDISELALLINGIQAVASFYAMLLGGKKSKAKLADPLIFVYPKAGGKDDSG